MTDITATISQTTITATITNPADISASLIEAPITATVEDGDVVSGTVSSTPIAATLMNGGVVTATVTETNIIASLISGIPEAPIDGTTYGRKDGGWAVAGGGSITVKEIDGSPSDTAVTLIQVPNGGLIDNGTGDVTLDYSISSHLHTGAYEPVDASIVRTGNPSWIDLTDGGATTLHSHGASGGDISGTGIVGRVAAFVTDTKTLEAAPLIADVMAGKILTIDLRSSVITRDVDGYITSIAKTGGRTFTVTRDGNGYISSITDTVNTFAMSRNASNYITAVTVT